ncbi:TolC family protein [Haoranjiania flava]|uniref:TolC family protein n=1 Tax=Haoranjiania flava TaxID=1856322 RepID=A0AAE3LKA0_9BACT|nr:TolC family protein [Haoranjiania flava]MCU7694393.1 TolC family protein [Haoranjiania flava]
MKKIAIIGIVLLSQISVQAQTLSLNEVLDSVSANHPVVKMYTNEIRSMDEAAKGARSWMPPEIGAGPFMTPYNPAMWRKMGDVNGMGSIAISVEQMIPNKKKLDADEAYMRAMSSVEKENLNANVNELRQDAKQLYYQWIVLRKRLSVVEESQKLLDFMIKNAEIRYKNGLEKIGAYYKAKAALGSALNMELMYENDIREKRIRLNALMNRNPLDYFEVDTNYRLNDYSLMVFDSSLFYQNRSDLKALDREINLRYLKQETERQSLKPQFGGRFEHMVGFGGQPMQYSAMVMMKLPIVGWASRMNKANIESLRWQAEALRSQKEMMVNEYSGMAYGMRNELDLNKKQLALYEQNIIPALRNNYKTMQLGYEQNTEELFMLFDAWEKLNMTQMEYLDILEKALQTQVSLDRLIEKK